MEISTEGLFHRYSDPPAILTASFDSGEVLEIFLGQGAQTYAILHDAKGKIVKSGAAAKQLEIPEVLTLSQVAPMARSERVLDRDYVRSRISSYLAPLHFRNQLHILPDHIDELRELAESTWPMIEIKKPMVIQHEGYRELMLNIRDGDFFGEIGLMGHGLQVWLQTMWFLARAPGEATVILDEPDVYMHADLQRKLIRLVRGRHQQTIIATHSTEILTEVEPESLLIVDRRTPASQFANDLPGAQRIIDDLGGVHNIALARLWTSRKFLVFEGEDLRILKRYQDTLYPDSQEPFDAIPGQSMGGYGEWEHATRWPSVLRNAAGEEVITYCILDSDYRPAAQRDEMHEYAWERGLQLYVWQKKEIENYLLVAAAIQRVILEHAPAAIRPPDADTVAAKMDEIAQSLKDEALRGMTTGLDDWERKWSAGTALSEAQARLHDAWRTWEGRMSRVSGKEMIARLSKWSQDDFNVSLSPVRIAQHLRRSEVAAEVAAVVRAIEKGIRFADVADLQTQD